MENENIKKYLDIIANEKNSFLDLENSNFYLFALKVKNWKESKNPVITLSYDFYDTQMNNKNIRNSLEAILNYTKNKYFLNDETEYRPYVATNPKTVIDYLILKKYDFSNTEIQLGTADNIDVDSYKVQYLIHKMFNGFQITKNEIKNFTGIKYTVL